MKHTIIIFPDAGSLSNFVFSRSLLGAEVSTEQCSVTAPMHDDDIIEAVADHKGYVTEEWPTLFKPKFKHPLFIALIAILIF